MVVMKMMMIIIIVIIIIHEILFLEIFTLKPKFSESGIWR